MNVSELIGKNIKDLMIKEEISLRKLSEEIGITHPTLGKYISGEQAIDSNKLSLVAHYFGKPMDYFFKEDHEEFNFKFRVDRACDDLSKQDIINLQMSMNSYLDVVNESKCSFIPPSYSLNISGKKIPSDIDELIEKIANEQRRLMKIEHIIPSNYYEVIEDLGINLICKDYNNDKFFGASSFSKEFGSFILINNSMKISEERKIFSLIHEYAHLLFHQDDYKCDGSNVFYKYAKSDLNEKVANKFAGYFLLPRKLMNDYADNRKKTVELIEMKKHFKISEMSLYVALHNYKEIKDDDYRNYFRSKNRTDSYHIEKEPIESYSLEEKNNRLINRIKELYNQESISANKVNEVLGLSTIETRKLLKKWRVLDAEYIQFK